MQILYSTILFCLVFAPYQAQVQKPLNLIDESEVTTISYWKQGESVKYEIQEISKTLKQKGDKKKEIKSEQTDLELVLSVLDSTEFAYKMEGFYSNIKVDQSLDEEDKKFSKLIEEIPIIYYTNELGTFDSLYNKKDLERATVKIIDEILDIYEMNNPIGQALMKPITDKLSDPENLTALYCEEILSIHLIQGGQWKKGKEYVLDIEFVTLNSFKVEGKAYVEIKKIDPKKKIAVFKIELEANEDQMAEYLQDLFVTLSFDLEKEFDPKSFKVDVSEKMTLTLDLERGWPILIDEFTVIKVRDKNQKFIREIDTFYRMKN